MHLQPPTSTFSFSFSLDTRKTATTKVVVEKKKNMSPSTMRRNMKRKQEFLRKKESSVQESNINSDLEGTSQVENSFKCDLCERVCKSENDLKIHKGKVHKISDPTQISY